MRGRSRDRKTAKTAGGEMDVSASVSDEVRHVFENATADSYEQEALRLLAVGERYPYAPGSTSAFTQAQVNATLAVKRAVEEGRA